MRLVIGGYAQGKLDYVLSRTGFSATDVADGANCELASPPAVPLIVDKLHILIRRLLLEKLDPDGFLDTIICANPDVLFICDEVVCGVIPLDGFEREWREAVGRTCCRLAQKSEHVERIFAGIPTVIK